MLFAVEGGGFFSSSAQGYSKGLSLLLLGQRNEERPMKIAPWSQYHLVEQERVPDFQLASRKSRSNHRCASFICFGRASAGSDGTFPPKVGPLQQPQSSNTVISSSNDNANDMEKKACLKSCLKRSENHSVAHELAEVESASQFTYKRKLQWRDACGRELVQIKEFECSGDETSDDDYENGAKKCMCFIQ